MSKMEVLDKELQEELQDLTPDEAETVLKLVQALKRTRVSPLAYIEEIMNFQFVGLNQEKNAYVYRMTITDVLKNRFKILHGGITATFIDTAMGSTVFKLLGENAKAVTADLSVRFLAPGESGNLFAYVYVIKQGKTIITLESKVVDEKEKLIATASATFFRLK